MPSTFTKEEKLAFMQANGIDPNKYDIDDNNDLVEKVINQPTVSQLPHEVTKAQSFTTAAKANIGGTIGGLAAGSAAGAGVAALTTAGLLSGVGTIPTLIGLGATALAGAGGAYIGNAAQQGVEKRIYTPEEQAALVAERDNAQRANPLSSLAGSLAPQAIALRPSLSTLKAGASAVSKLPFVSAASGLADDAGAVASKTAGIGSMLQPMEKAALREVGTGAAFGGAIDAGQQLYNTGTIDPAALALNVAAGGLLTKPTKLVGQGIFRMPASEVATANQKAGMVPTTEVDMSKPLAETAQAQADLLKSRDYLDKRNAREAEALAEAQTKRDARQPALDEQARIKAWKDAEKKKVAEEKWLQTELAKEAAAKAKEDNQLVPKVKDNGKLTPEEKLMADELALKMIPVGEPVGVTRPPATAKDILSKEQLAAKLPTPEEQAALTTEAQGELNPEVASEPVVDPKIAKQQLKQQAKIDANSRLYSGEAEVPAADAVPVKTRSLTSTERGALERQGVTEVRSNDPHAAETGTAGYMDPTTASVGLGTKAGGDTVWHEIYHKIVSHMGRLGSETARNNLTRIQNMVHEGAGLFQKATPEETMASKVGIRTAALEAAKREFGGQMKQWVKDSASMLRAHMGKATADDFVNIFARKVRDDASYFSSGAGYKDLVDLTKAGGKLDLERAARGRGGVNEIGITKRDSLDDKGEPVSGKVEGMKYQDASEANATDTLQSDAHSTLKSFVEAGNYAKRPTYHAVVSELLSKHSDALKSLPIRKTTSQELAKVDPTFSEKIAFYAVHGNSKNMEPGIYINTDYDWHSKPSFLHRAVLHETVHGLTTEYINSVEKGGGWGYTTDDIHVNKLLNLKAQAERILDQRQRAAYKAGQQIPEGMYGFKNIHEFVAEALSNKKFQKFLASTNTPKYLRSEPTVSMWDSFVNTIKNILGIKDKTLLEDVLRASTDLIDAANPKLPEYPKAPYSKLDPDMDMPSIKYQAESESPSGDTPAKESWLEGITKHLKSGVERAAKVSPVAAKGIENFYRLHNRYLGVTNTLMNEVRPLLKGASRTQSIKNDFYGDSESVQRVHANLQAQADGLDAPHSLNEQEQKFADKVREYLVKLGEERNTRADAHGILHKGELNPNYLPNMLSRTVLRELLRDAKSELSQMFHKDFVEHIMAKGKPEEFAEERWTKLIKGYTKTGEADIAKNFGPFDDSAGFGLPPSMREHNLIQLLTRYGDRAARRLAYHDAIEVLPDTLAELERFKANPEVLPLVEDMAGIRDKEEANRNVLGGIVRAGFMQLPTGLRDAVASPFMGLQHMDLKQWPSAIANSMRHYSDNLAETFAMGVNSNKINSIEMAEHMNTEESALTNKGRAVRDFMNKYSGRQYLETISRTITYGTGKDLAMKNALDFIDGKASAQQKKFLKDLGPDGLMEKLSNDKTVDINDVKEMAARYTESVQGTYDPREVPMLALRGSWAPVLSLAKWNLGKMNNFRKYSIEPAIKDHNFTPLLTQTVGAMLGGQAILELNKFLSKKEERQPKWSEVKYAWDHDGKYVDALSYKLAGLASAAGYAGFLGDIVKSVSDKLHGNSAQGYNNVLIDVATKNYETAVQAVKAWDEGNFELGIAVLDKMASDNIQNYRTLMLQVDPERQKKAEDQNKSRDLRTFRQVTGQDTADLTTIKSNPFERREEKKFKKSENVGEAAKMVPSLLKQAFENASKGGRFNPEIYKKELSRLKANSFQTMPSPESMPLQFRNYLAYLTDTQGPEAASARLTEYMKRNSVNKYKSGMIPSVGK